MTLTRESISCCVGDGNIPQEIKDVRRMTTSKSASVTSKSAKTARTDTASVITSTTKRPATDQQQDTSSKQSNSSMVALSLAQVSVSNLHPGKKIDDATIYRLLSSVSQLFLGCFLNPDHDQATMVLEGKEYAALLGRVNSSSNNKRRHQLKSMFESSLFLIPLLSVSQDHWMLAAVWNIGEMVTRIIRKTGYPSSLPDSITLPSAHDRKKIGSFRIVIYDSLEAKITGGFKSRIKMELVTGIVQEIIHYITNRKVDKICNFTSQIHFTLANCDD